MAGIFTYINHDGQQTEQDESHARESRITIPQPVVDRQAAAVGAQRIAQIECHLHQSRPQHLAAARIFEDQQLLG